jgi:hypothetical protein
MRPTGSILSIPTDCGTPWACTGGNGAWRGCARCSILGSSGPRGRGWSGASCDSPTGAGLSVPLTREWVNDFEVDFFWPDLGLVVETDGARYHRTPARQTRDRERDQAHTVAGLTQLRFTEDQIDFEAPYVIETLRSVARRLEATRAT